MADQAFRFAGVLCEILRKKQTELEPCVRKGFKPVALSHFIGRFAHYFQPCDVGKSPGECESTRIRFDGGMADLRSAETIFQMPALHSFVPTAVGRENLGHVSQQLIVETPCRSLIFADVFKLWNLEHEPAIVIGMDVLGTVDAIMVDYRRGELRVLPRGASDNIEVRPTRPGRLD